MDAELKNHLDRLGRRNVGFSYINKNGLGIKKQFNKRSMVSLSQEDYDDIVGNAKRRNINMSEMIRTYITWGLENDKS